MDAIDLVRTQRRLTIEELKFLEAEALRWAREVYTEAEKIAARAKGEHADLALSLRASAGRMVWSLEQAGALEWDADDRQAADELKLLARDLVKLRTKVGLSSGPRKPLRFWQMLRAKS